MQPEPRPDRHAPEPLHAARLELILGKGGVGRTTTTAAWAMSLARRGRPVLVAEVGEGDDAHSALGRLFGRETLNDEPARLLPVESAVPLFGVCLSARAGQSGFLRGIVPAGGGLLAGALRSDALTRFLDAAPAVHEMGQLAHLSALLKQTAPDGSPAWAHVIVDLPATGHALSLAQVPRAMEKLIPVGPIARGLKAGQAFVRDPARTAMRIVSLPETMPVSEALDLMVGLRAQGLEVTSLFLNRVVTLPGPLSSEGEAAVETLLAHGPLQGRQAWQRLLAARDATARLPPDLPVCRLPERAGLSGVNLVSALAEDFARGGVSGEIA